MGRQSKTLPTNGFVDVEMSPPPRGKPEGSSEAAPARPEFTVLYSILTESRYVLPAVKLLLLCCVGTVWQLFPEQRTALWTDCDYTCHKKVRLSAGPSCCQFVSILINFKREGGELEQNHRTRTWPGLDTFPVSSSNGQLQLVNTFHLGH